MPLQCVGSSRLPPFVPSPCFSAQRLPFPQANRTRPSLRRATLLAGTAALALLLAPGENARADNAPSTGSREALPTIDVTTTPPSGGQAQDGGAASGYRTGEASVGPLGETPLKDAPYSVHDTPGQLIENRNAHTEGDALMTNPTVSVSVAPNAPSASLSRVFIRGFNASDQSELRDGLVDRSFTFPPVENVERIEVLGGLSCFLYGFSNLGGTVNYISKKPTPDFHADLTTASMAAASALRTPTWAARSTRRNACGSASISMARMVQPSSTAAGRSAIRSRASSASRRVPER